LTTQQRRRIVRKSIPQRTRVGILATKSIQQYTRGERLACKSAQQHSRLGTLARKDISKKGAYLHGKVASNTVQ
jgi:hypothetical protein